MSIMFTLECVMRPENMKSAARIDSASRRIQASPAAVYLAFATPGAMEQWLPPDGMAGQMLHFDFRAGGSYRMRLTYREATPGLGKTTGDADEVDVRFTKLEYGQRIEQAVDFQSEDPAFAGTMRVTWTLQPVEDGTLVSVRAEDVPDGILPDDHAAGMRASLENLARFVENGANQGGSHEK